MSSTAGTIWLGIWPDNGSRPPKGRESLTWFSVPMHPDHHRMRNTKTNSMDKVELLYIHRVIEGYSIRALSGTKPQHLRQKHR